MEKAQKQGELSVPEQQQSQHHEILERELISFYHPQSCIAFAFAFPSALYFHFHFRCQIPIKQIVRCNPIHKQEIFFIHIPLHVISSLNNALPTIAVCSITKKTIEKVNHIFSSVSLSACLCVLTLKFRRQFRRHRLSPFPLPLTPLHPFPFLPDRNVPCFRSCSFYDSGNPTLPE